MSTTYAVARTKSPQVSHYLVQGEYGRKKALYTTDITRFLLENVVSHKCSMNDTDPSDVREVSLSLSLWNT
jgi:hypothetical protein